MENLRDLIYEHYTENNLWKENTTARKAGQAKEKELEQWLQGIEGMDQSGGGRYGGEDTTLGGDHDSSWECMLCMGERFI